MKQEKYKKDYVQMVGVVEDLKLSPSNLRECCDPDNYPGDKCNLTRKVYTSCLLPLPYLFEENKIRRRKRKEEGTKMQLPNLQMHF